MKKSNYKLLLTEYLEKRLKNLAGVDDYDKEKLVLKNLLYSFTNYRSNDVILAKLNIMLDADKKVKRYASRFDGCVAVPSEYDYSKDKIARECLEYLQKESVIGPNNHIV